MSNFKGTEEKWIRSGNLIYADDFFQTHIAIIPDSYNEDIKQANAQLIANAPEMLKMLEEINLDGHHFSGWERLEKLIKKAIEI